MKSKGFLLDLFIVWDNHSKMKWITQHHVLTETKLQPAKVSFLFIWSYFTNGMQFPEQAYLDENIYHRKYLVQHCGCRITNQATVLKNKTNQLLVLQARNLVRKEHVVRAREVICGRGNFIAQAENGTAVWIKQFLFRAGIFSKNGEAAKFLVLCQTEWQYYSSGTLWLARSFAY